MIKSEEASIAFKLDSKKSEMKQEAGLNYAAILGKQRNMQKAQKALEQFLIENPKIIVSLIKLPFLSYFLILFRFMEE